MDGEAIKSVGQAMAEIPLGQAFNDTRLLQGPDVRPDLLHLLQLRLHGGPEAPQHHRGRRGPAGRLPRHGSGGHDPDPGLVHRHDHQDPPRRRRSGPGPFTSRTWW
ncbi:MAG: hypothetical protein MZU97_12590 [Bacillus subtilis]|nr:hypothetical protein [Bacillus subtilis]